MRKWRQNITQIAASQISYNLVVFFGKYIGFKPKIPPKTAHNDKFEVF